MSISYKKLFERMKEQGIRKTHLRYIHHMNSKTINRLSKDRNVTVDTIVQLCEILKCQPGDIMECVNKSNTNISK